MIPISRPDLGATEIAAATRVLTSGWLMQGPEVAAFESEFAAFVGAPHAVATSSGTTALELALRACGVGQGDEVLTVSHSFIATANCIRAVNANPRFVDIEPATLGLDPRLLEAAIGPRTKAIVCAHQVGIPCDLGAILAIAACRHLIVVEDAACALGSEIRVDNEWQRIGKPHGRVACFSFHPRKILTTGEGGMITTADADLAIRLRRLRAHGLGPNPAPSEREPRQVALEPGFNARLTDLQAAIGRPQLRRLLDTLAERRRQATLFDQALVSNPVLRPMSEPVWARGNFQSYVAWLREGTRWSSEQVIGFLHDQGVGGRPGIVNAHEEPAYRETNGGGSAPLPVSEYASRSTVFLPLFHGMLDVEHATVMAALADLGRR